MKRNPLATNSVTERNVKTYRAKTLQSLLASLLPPVVILTVFYENGDYDDDDDEEEKIRPDLNKVRYC